MANLAAGVVGDLATLTTTPVSTKMLTASSQDVTCKSINETILEADEGFSYTLAILFGIPASIIITITIIGNLLVLCFKASIGRQQTKMLIWNLGLADFLVGVVVLPMGVVYVISRRWMFGRILCKIWTCADLVFCTASIVTLCAIAIDRYVGVTRPLLYRIIVTKGRVKIGIASIWIFSSGVLLFSLSYEEPECYNPSVCRVVDELKYVVHSVVIAFFIPAIVTIGLYYKIYVIAREREKCIKDGLMITMGDNFFTACVVNEPMRVHYGRQRERDRQKKIIRMHKIIAKTLGVVVTAFIICWLPFFSTYLVGYHCHCIPPIVPDILTWLGYCNSMINPIIYAFTIREFKTSIDRMFTFFAKKLHMKKREDDGGLEEELPNLTRLGKRNDLLEIPERIPLSRVMASAMEPRNLVTYNNPSHLIEACVAEDAGLQQVDDMQVETPQLNNMRMKKKSVIENVDVHDAVTFDPAMTQDRRRSVLTSIYEAGLVTGMVEPAHWSAKAYKILVAGNTSTIKLDKSLNVATV